MCKKLLETPINYEVTVVRVEIPKVNSIMQRALYILLQSVEMIALLRLGAIFLLSVIVPVQYLSAKTHILAHLK